MPEPEKETPSTLTFGDLKKLITDTVESLTKAGKDVTGSAGSTHEPFTKATGGASVDDQVKAALAKLQADKEREDKEKERDTTLAELKTKLDEKAPVERRRVHKLMGWGE